MLEIIVITFINFKINQKATNKENLKKRQQIRKTVKKGNKYELLGNNFIFF